MKSSRKGPRSRKKKMAITVTPRQETIIKSEASRLQISEAAFIRRAIDNYIDSKGLQEPDPLKRKTELCGQVHDRVPEENMTSQAENQEEAQEQTEEGLEEGFGLPSEKEEPTEWEEPEPFPEDSEIEELTLSDFLVDDEETGEELVLCPGCGDQHEPKAEVYKHHCDCGCVLNIAYPEDSLAVLEGSVEIEKPSKDEPLQSG